MMPQRLFFARGEAGYVLSEDKYDGGKARLWAFTSIEEVAAFLIEQYDTPEDDDI